MAAPGGATEGARGAGGARALASSHSLPQLRSLSLVECSLVRSPYLGQLRELFLGSGLPEEVVAAVKARFGDQVRTGPADCPAHGLAPAAGAAGASPIRWNILPARAPSWSRYH